MRTLSRGSQEGPISGPHTPPMTHPETAPTRVLVWDLPTRFLHWLLAASFLGAFAIAQLADEHSPVFAVHMLLGALAALAVVLRAVWGFIGSRYARFGNFAFGPRDLIRYLRGAFGRDGEKFPGHNPANAWAAYAMLALTLGLAITGVLMSRGGHAMKEVHEVLAYAMIAVVGAHVAGIVLYTLRRRENIALGMIDGKKAAEPAQAIPSRHPVAALVFVSATCAWTAMLVRGYDAQSQSIRVPGSGSTIQLGEGEKGERKGGERGRREKHRDEG